jgi:hypothetical protein
MATLNTLALSMADWAKRLDPNGKTAAVIELMNETNEVLDDIVWVEGNLPTGHRTTVRTGLPTPTWRKLNYGVQPTKSVTAQVDESCGMLEAYADIDKALADLNGNSKEFRLSEDRAHIEGMNQEFIDTLIYGDSDQDPEQFMGLDVRYPALASPHVINAGGSGTDVTSIWLVVWGYNTIHGIFPKGSKAGLGVMDKGQVTLYDAAGGKYEGYETHYKWDCGLAVRDWRYAVRIANVELAGTDDNWLDSTNPTAHKMIEAINRIPDLSQGNAVFYCNRTMKTQMDIAAYEKWGGFRLEEIFGKRVTSFQGIPVRRVDGLQSESALT